MPILAIIYAGYLGWAVVQSLHDEMKHHDPGWYVALDFLLGLVMAAAFLGYWIRPIVEAAPQVAPYLFVASWAWGLGWAPHEIRRCVAGLDSEWEKRLYVRFGIWLETALALPAFWFGGRAVLRVL